MKRHRGVQPKRRYVQFDRTGPTQRFLNIARSEDKLVNSLRLAGAVPEPEADYSAVRIPTDVASKGRKVSA